MPVLSSLHELFQAQACDLYLHTGPAGACGWRAKMPVPLIACAPSITWGEDMPV